MPNDRDYDRDDRRPRRRRREYDDRESYPVRKDVSVLGIVALVIGIKALLASMVPCFGAFAIVVAAVALFLAGASVLVARNSRQGMGFPIAASIVSSLAVAISLVWVAVFSAMFGVTSDRAASRPASPLPSPPPQVVQPQLKFPQKKIDPPAPIDDEQFQKQLLEDLAKDRIKEAIRNGPGLAVTAEKVDADYRANVVAAEATYNDKVLEVTGKVVRVIRENGQRHYTLELEAGVACEFIELAKRPLAALAPGQTVTVRGFCTGRSADIVKLKDCVLVK